MEEMVYNYDNIKYNEVNETITRVKLIMINDLQEVLLGYCDGIYQFVGGHIKENEGNIEGLEREVEEETGIKVNLEGIKPFFCIKNYSRNYNNTDLNVLSQIYYYIIRNNSNIRYENVNYDEQEIKGNYKLKYVPFQKIEKVLIDNIKSNKKNEIIVQEMLNVIDYIKNNDLLSKI